MNAVVSVELSPSHFVAPDRGDAAALKRARSDFIDAYNRADAAVRDLLHIVESPCTQNFGDNLQALHAAKSGAVYTPDMKRSVDKRIATLRSITSLRNHIVHGIMAVKSVDGLSHAFFENVQCRSGHGMFALVINEEELVKATRVLNAAAQSIASRGKATRCNANDGVSPPA